MIPFMSSHMSEVILHPQKHQKLPLKLYLKERLWKTIILQIMEKLRRNITYSQYGHVSLKEDYKTKWLTLHTICIVRAPATYQPWFCRWDLMGWDYGVSAMRSISALVRRTRHRMGSVIQAMSATVISIFLIRMTALCTKRDMRSHQDWPLGSLDYQGRPQKTVLIRVMA